MGSNPWRKTRVGWRSCRHSVPSATWEVFSPCVAFWPPRPSRWPMLGSSRLLRLLAVLTILGPSSLYAEASIDRLTSSALDLVDHVRILIRGVSGDYAAQ